MAINDRQRAFVIAYCGEAYFNATEAARLAGYSSKTANEQGARLLANVSIRAEIDRILGDKAMGAGEVLSRLTDIARGDMGDFLRVDGDEDGAIVDVNLGKAKEAGKLRLIRKFKIRKRDLPGDAGGTETTTEFELLDPLKALALLGKAHRLFGEAQVEKDDEEDDSTDSGTPEKPVSDADLALEAELAKG